MHSSPKLQYRKKHLPLPSCWILIWHIFPHKGTFCICPNWYVTSLHCLADRNILFFLTKIFPLQFRSIIFCPNHNRQKEVVTPLWSTGAFFILDICWHIFSLKLFYFQFSHSNLLSLLSLTCFPDLIIHRGFLVDSHLPQSMATQWGTAVQQRFCWSWEDQEEGSVWYKFW